MMRTTSSRRKLQAAARSFMAAVSWDGLIDEEGRREKAALPAAYVLPTTEGCFVYIVLASR